MNKQKTNKLGFTLVELIVVITILAILGTIAFISMQHYSASARDSTRISDMSKIKTTLELFHLNAGKYPASTDFFDVRYSGALAWTQGTFGTPTFTNVENLDKVPLDPLTDREYIYSVTNNKQEFEIGGIMERYQGGTLGSIIGKETYAGDKKATLRITGTYNGKVLKVMSGSTAYILAVPSIITSTGGTLDYIIQNGALGYDGYQNLPAQYSGSTYDVQGEGNLNIINPDKLVVYSGSFKDLNLNNEQGKNLRAQFLKEVQDAYTGAIMEYQGGVDEIMDSKTETEIEDISVTILGNILGGKLISDSSTNAGSEGNGGDGGEPEVDLFANCTGVNTPPVGDPSIIGNTTYGLCNSPDIIVCSGPGTGYAISACNVGTNISGTDSESFGEFFQWGNNAGIKTASTSTTQIGATTDNSTYNNPLFIGGTTWMNNDWTSTRNDNLWGDNSGIGTSEQRKGPCEIGYHIPSLTEWLNIFIAGGWGTDSLSAAGDLKIPRSGYREFVSTNISNDFTFGYYWTSTPESDDQAKFMFFNEHGVGPEDNHSRANGCSIRCIKN